MSAESYLPLLRMSLGMQESPQINKEEHGAAVEAMDPESRKFLEEAIKACSRTPVDDMKDLLASLRATDDPATIQSNLGDLQDLVENLDVARDFNTIGGLEYVINELLTHPSSSLVRSCAASLVGTVVHNMPPLQQVAFEQGCLNKLCVNCEREDAEESERIKSLFGLANLVRSHDASTVAFVKEHKGIALVLRMMNTDLVPQKRKAAFLLVYLLNRAPAIIPAVLPSAVPVMSATILDHKEAWEDVDLRESLLQIVDLFSQKKTAASLHLLRPLLQSIESKLHESNDDEAEQLQSVRDMLSRTL